MVDDDVWSLRQEIEIHLTHVSSQCSKAEKLLGNHGRMIGEPFSRRTEQYNELLKLPDGPDKLRKLRSFLQLVEHDAKQVDRWEYQYQLSERYADKVDEEALERDRKEFERTGEVRRTP